MVRLGRNEPLGMSSTLAQQFIIAIAALTLLTATVALARANRLSFSTAVLWSSIAGIGLVGAALVPLLATVGDLLGVMPAALFAGSASVVLTVIVFLQSVRISWLEDTTQALAESLAVAITSSAQSSSPPRPSGISTAALVVVPAFNEELSIRRVVTDLKDSGMSVLVVDDGSTDRTAAAASETGAVVLRLPMNLGVGGALRAGAKYALHEGFTQIVQCDGDGQHPADEVRRLIALQADHPVDLLIGSRFLDGATRRDQPFVRRTAMRMLARAATHAAGVPITDASSGLRAIREPLLTQVAKHLPRHYLGDTFELTVSAGRAGYTIREVSVAMRPREHGASTASFFTALALTIRSLLLVVLRAHLPLLVRESRQTPDPDL